MRIAIVARSRRLVGGAETTVAAPMADFTQAGHQVGLWCELDRPRDRGLIPVPDNQTSWCAELLGEATALAALRSWQPDVLLVHGLGDPATEDRILGLAPGVFFAHNYYGTCISGNKTFTFPRTRPCSERFGWPCVLRYYPRRTGGLNPATMMRQFRKQSQRLVLMRRYRFLAVLSEHMRGEYVRHGLEPQRIVRVPPPHMRHSPSAGSTPPPAPGRDGQPLRLLFVGRMDPLKGGAHLLRAATRVARVLGSPVEVTLAGDGPARTAWEALAGRTGAGTSVTSRFLGWVAPEALPQLFAQAHLLVVPSLWPEPFGLIGLEAAATALPAVAFAVGGMPEWLQDGINGHLASGEPPTVSGLAEAVLQAVRDPEHYLALRRGAHDAARRLDPVGHAHALLDLLGRAAHDEGAAIAV
jgi:glycosyltransferase involved in cell wall biosynthesis